MSRVILIVAVISCLAIGGCSDNPSAPGDNLPRPVTDEEEELIDSFNSFGLRLFGEIAAGEREKNVFISPLSVSMALGMTYNGANGTTEEAMRDVLGFDDLTLEGINRAYRSLIELLSNLDRDVQFEIANSIWYRQGLTFKEDFINRNMTYFNAVVQGLNFSDPAASGIINGWVSEKTNGRIEEIVPQKINPFTVMFLINAIYFKAAWTEEFDKDETKDDFFTVPDGSQTPCRMMNQSGEFRYFRSSDFEAIDLPYGNGDFSMVVVSPLEGRGVGDIITGLGQEEWRSWLGSFEEKEGHLQVPKFTLEYDIELNDVLSALGMGVAFDEAAADFSGMYAGPENLYISKVKHKTFVKVDEEGTEAAGVTSVEVGRTSIDGFWMRVDRPFLFAIRDSHSQTILFIGKVVEPILE